MSKTKNVLSENIAGRYVDSSEKVFGEIHKILEENAMNVAKLNNGIFNEDEKRELISEIVGEKLDETVQVMLPFYTDFGKHISFGKSIFVNMGVMFTDLGGIVLEDKVLIGPGAKLLSVNHPINSTKRRGIEASPIIAWIGANATILAGVIVGKNSIVAAGAVINRDVPDNVIVGGIPAKVIKKIKE